MQLYRIPHGMTGFELAKQAFHLTPDQLRVGQDLRFYLNVIRSINQDAPFRVKAGGLNRILNGIVDGRDAKNVELQENFDIWLPSLQYTAQAKVGSGSVSAETSQFLDRQLQRVRDYKHAVELAARYLPEALGHHLTEDVQGLLVGLIQFLLEALAILAASTAIGAIIGAFAGGVGAAPGAAIGFEIGLQIVKLYGLAMLAEFVLNKIGSIASSLGTFIEIAWNANGDPGEIERAARMCADTMGNFVALMLEAVVAWALARGGVQAKETISKTRFGQIVGETRIVRWLDQRLNAKARRDRMVLEDQLNRLADKIGEDYKNDPRRKAYEAEVESLAPKAEALKRQQGTSAEALEQIAKQLWEERRQLGARYKEATPKPLRDYIRELNMNRYSGDELGPSWDYMMDKYKGNYNEIIEASSRPNPSINDFLGGFRKWLQENPDAEKYLK